jgi:hypothetical protein
MAIVKAIADAHGATVQLDAGPGAPGTGPGLGQGLAVAVTFPPSSFLRNTAAVER